MEVAGQRHAPASLSPKKRPVPIVIHKDKGKGTVDPRTGHEGPEGE
jgi:hypothetical protein